MILLKWLRNLLGLTLLIQVDSTVPTINRSADESIKTLQAHPGFIEVHNRLRIQRALLESRLVVPTNSHEDDVWLKAGIYWSKYYHAEVDRLVNKKDVPHARAASSDVMDEFNKVNAQYERVS